MKFRYALYTITLFLLCITNTYAACTQEDKKEFKKIEDEYTVKYEFNKGTKDYTVTFNIPLPDKYGYTIDENMNTENYVTSTDNSFTFSGIKPGQYKIEVIGVTNSCSDVLKEITLKLSKYNSYSEDPLCDGIEEFVLCQPTYDKEIDYETFVSRVNTYKKNHTNKVDEEPQEEPEENIILQYIKDNLFQIIIIIVFIILLTITIIVTAKSIRKSRRLE